MNGVTRLTHKVFLDVVHLITVNNDSQLQAQVSLSSTDQPKRMCSSPFEYNVVKCTLSKPLSAEIKPNNRTHVPLDQHESQHEDSLQHTGSGLVTFGCWVFDCCF